MTQQDVETIIGIAALAAMADGTQDAQELSAIQDAARRLGFVSADDVIRDVAAGHAAMPELATRLTSSDARHTAYDVALGVCSANGRPTPSEDDFLRTLATLLEVDVSASNTAAADAMQQVSAFSAPPPIVASGPVAGQPASGTLDNHILDQAILTAALELLPDRLANLAILPLQMRLVRHIGQQFGQQMDANQIKDLAGTFGLGAAAQIMESVVRKAFGGIAGGLLGGLLGGVAGTAAGGALTFASTYALGHAAEQYYAQGRSLSTADMKALFARFKAEAQTIYPRVQDRIATRAQGTNLSSLMRTMTG